MLHVSLGGSFEGAIIGELKVVDGVRLNLGLPLKSPAHSFKRVGQHSGEHQAEEGRGEDIARLTSFET